VSRRDDQRLTDILAAAAAIADHITRGTLDDGLVFDAVRVFLIESVKQSKPSIPTCSCGNRPSRGWTLPVCAATSPIGTFDTAHAIVQATLSEDLPPLVAAPPAGVGSPNPSERPSDHPVERRGAEYPGSWFDEKRCFTNQELEIG
jgi:hypothetical protein